MKRYTFLPMYLSWGNIFVPRNLFLLSMWSTSYYIVRRARMRFDNEVILSMWGRNCSESTWFLRRYISKPGKQRQPWHLALPAAGQGGRKRGQVVIPLLPWQQASHQERTLRSERLLFSKWEFEPVALELGSIALLHSVVGEKFLSFKLLV